MERSPWLFIYEWNPKHNKSLVAAKAAALHQLKHTIFKPKPE
jgi:hypothetical protein